MLSVNNLEKSFGRNKVLSNVSFKIEPGEVVGLIGKNGAGKTTLMKCILGLVHYDSGNIIFMGNADYLHEEELLNKVGFLLDCKLYENMNAFENIKIQEIYSKGRWDSTTIEDALKFVGLANDKKQVKNYSFGMKQRLGLGISLIDNPLLLIVDEPFVGLDPKGIETIKKYLTEISKKKGVSILLSSHQIAEIEDLCDRFLLLSDKRIVEYDRGKQKIHLTVGNLSSDIMQKVKGYGCLLNANTFILEYNMEVLNVLVRQIVMNGGYIEDISFVEDSLKDLFKGERPVHGRSELLK